MSISTQIAELTPVTLSKKIITNAYGQPTQPSASYNFKCSFKIGADKQFIDGDGNTFTPSATIYFEVKDEFTPELGDRITLNNVDYDVKSVMLHDCSAINQKDDYTVMCK